MKTHLYSLFSALILIALLGCEKVLDVPGPIYHRLAVMTGLIHPDSLLSVQLTFTAPPNTQTPYERIKNAEVSFYEDDRLLATVSNQLTGYYAIEQKPIAGKSYRVVAQIPDYGTVEAADRLPMPTVAKLAVSDPKPTNPNGNPDLQLSLQTIQSNQYYWLSNITLTNSLRLSANCPPEPPGGFGGLPPGCTLDDFLRTERNYFVTNDTRTDRFNSFFESSRGTYLYLTLLRFDPALLRESAIQLDFTFHGKLPTKRFPGEKTYLDVIVAGEAMDRYLKSSLQSSMNRIRDPNDALNNPFAEVTPVYSNVKNGLGIVGAANSIRITF